MDGTLTHGGYDYSLRVMPHSPWAVQGPRFAQAGLEIRHPDAVIIRCNADATCFFHVTLASNVTIFRNRKHTFVYTLQLDTKFLVISFEGLVEYFREFLIHFHQNRFEKRRR